MNRSDSPRVLVNHVGYDATAPKRLVFQTTGTERPAAFRVVARDGTTALRGELGPAEPVDRWSTGACASADFSALRTPGWYRCVVEEGREAWQSEWFEVRPALLAEECLSDILFYFKSQRCSGVWDETDRAVPFTGGRADRVDVHGGWYDASGDQSKYLSHLSYANFMNPQQTQLVVWGLQHGLAQLRHTGNPRLVPLAERIAQEVAHGADFLVRMQDPDGYLYLTVFDTWSHDPAQRTICAFETQQGHKGADYQAGYRQGGGVAIAALARAVNEGITGAYRGADYLEAAETGFEHLETHNHEYLNDGRENILDDYCALLGAIELYGATGNAAYLEAARRRRAALAARLTGGDAFTDWWRADNRGERPFFHAADAGLPVVALLRYTELEPDAGERQKAREAVEASLRFELAITGAAVNPFGYARQYVKPVNGERRVAFFFPHDNESGYWWQGESARLGSLAAAALLAVPAVDRDLAAELERYAADQINWVLGLNPFDMCLMKGRGRNAPGYFMDPFPNAPGGVSNGITAGVDDERDIAYMPEAYADGLNIWRWSEQWIPHGAWLFIAVAALERRGR